MNFEIIGNIESIETIAVSKSIKDFSHIRRQYGLGRWRKMKGKAKIRLINDSVDLFPKTLPKVSGTTKYSVYKIYYYHILIFQFCETFGRVVYQQNH